MAIVGFSFSKIKAEKKAAPKGKINIGNNIRIVGVSETEFGLDKTKKGLKVEVDFDSKFEPNVGSILLSGEVLLLEETKKAEDILKEWSKSKTMSKEITAAVLNTALNKCNVEALILSQQINLPPPIPMPKVAVTEPQKESAKKA